MGTPGITRIVGQNAPPMRTSEGTFHTPNDAAQNPALKHNHLRASLNSKLPPYPNLQEVAFQHASAAPTAPHIARVQNTAGFPAVPLQEPAVLPFSFPLTPGEQLKTVQDVYARDPLLKASTDLGALNALLYQAPSVEITKRLLNHYQTDLQLNEKLQSIGIDPDHVAETFLFTTPSKQYENFMYEPKVSAQLESINQNLTLTQHQKLLQNIFGAGLTLSPRLTQESASQITKTLVGLARNSDEMRVALERLGQAAVEFDVLAKNSTSDEANFDFVILPRRGTETLDVKLDPEGISTEYALPYTASVVQKTLEIEDRIPPSRSRVEQTMQGFLAPQHLPIDGLLPPRPRLFSDDPIVTLQQHAHQLHELARQMDQAHAKKDNALYERLAKEFDKTRASLEESWAEVSEKYGFKFLHLDETPLQEWDGVNGGLKL